MRGNYPLFELLVSEHLDKPIGHHLRVVFNGNAERSNPILASSRIDFRRRFT